VDSLDLSDVGECMNKADELEKDSLCLSVYVSAEPSPASRKVDQDDQQKNQEELL
jgi:hypothetical protein